MKHPRLLKFLRRYHAHLWLALAMFAYSVLFARNIPREPGYSFSSYVYFGLGLFLVGVHVLGLEVEADRQDGTANL